MPKKEKLGVNWDDVFDVNYSLDLSGMISLTRPEGSPSERGKKFLSTYKPITDGDAISSVVFNKLCYKMTSVSDKFGIERKKDFKIPYRITGAHEAGIHYTDLTKVDKSSYLLFGVDFNHAHCDYTSRLEAGLLQFHPDDSFKWSKAKPIVRMNAKFDAPISRYEREAVAESVYRSLGAFLRI
jgi:hypothetical protein